MKPDLIIAAAYRYDWDKLRPFVMSLARSGFSGAKVILGESLDPHAITCAKLHGFEVVPCDYLATPTPWWFMVKYRFIPLLHFLASHKREYRYVVWVDCGDLIFQGNPSDWLDRHATPHTVIAARECWHIKDDLRFNDPWVKAAVPDEHDWLREEEILCSGTIAGDTEIISAVATQLYRMIDGRLDVSDQAALNYVLRKPFNFTALVPKMQDGWTATCSAFKTDSFQSLLGRDESLLLDKAPFFDKEQALVFTPDRRNQFVIVHQYNRDPDWANLIPNKYKRIEEADLIETGT